MSTSDLPGRVFMQPHFYPASLKRLPVSKGDLAAGVRDSGESDFESLAQERQYQLELQQRVRENEALVGLSSDVFENDSLEDSWEETSVKEQEGGKHDTDPYTTGMQKSASNGRKHQSVDKYFNLRYNPNWKNMKGIAEFSEVKAAHQIPSRNSVELSQDPFYLLSNDCPKENTQQMAKLQDISPDFDTKILNFHEPNAMVSKKPFRLHVKGKESEKDCHFKDSPSTFSSAFSLQIQNQQERAKKDFVAKNKRTLGLGTRMGNSYLQIHCKKQGEDLQEQVEDTKAVDEAAVQNVLPFQNMKMDPEDKWTVHLNGKRLAWSQFGSSSYFPRVAQYARTLIVTAEVELTNHHLGTGSQDSPGLKLSPKHSSLPPYSSTHSSPAALCPASQLTKTLEQHQQESTCWTEAPLADRPLFSLLPPIKPQLESSSELNAERGKGSQVKISRSNSEGYLMQMEKQKQPRANKKLYRSKAYYTHLNVRLGGLGPDYEAVREKKEKLRQQKEYAKQINEHNMKNITSVQRLPAKPNVTTSVSRQKALEYAKKIPRPKTFVTRQPEEEVREERVLSQILRRHHLPQIASLETLQVRHEKEKQVVAAFRTLHIL